MLRALWSAEAATAAGVTRPDPFYPLAEATNEPPPRTPGGPPLWLGGQKRRGIALAAAVADGWLLPAVVALGSPSDLDYFSDKRDASCWPRSAAIGRDPATFDIAAQVADRHDRRGPALGARPGARRRQPRRDPRHPRHAARAWAPPGSTRSRAEVADAVARGPRLMPGRRATAVPPRSGGSSEADLATLAALVDALTPDDPTSLEEMRWTDATYPGTARFLAEVDGRAVGAATRRPHLRLPTGPSRCVLGVARRRARRHRRRGHRRALLVALSDAARAAGKTGLQLRDLGRPARGHRLPAPPRLHRAGAGPHGRSCALEGLAPPAVEPPDGIALTTLAERPELVDGVHAVAIESFEDIPGGDTPMAAGDLAEFRARDVDRPGIPPDAFMIAIDASTDEVVGYASLMFVPGSTTVAWHDMTAVAPGVAWPRARDGPQAGDHRLGASTTA